MKILTKNLLNVVLGLGVALGASGASGQEQAVNRHATAQGCAVFETRSATEKDPLFSVRGFQWSGACVDGFAQGLGVLVWQNYDPYKKRWDNRWAGAGEMRAGKRLGWWLAPNRIEKGVLLESYQEGVRKKFASFNDPNKPAVTGYPQATVPAVTEWLGSGGARTDRLPYSYLIAALDTYYKDEAAFLAGRIPGDWDSVSSSGATQTPSSSSRDDPKVFGRGARGG